MEGNLPGTYLASSMHPTPASLYFSDSGGDAFFCPLPRPRQLALTKVIARQHALLYVD